MNLAPYVLAALLQLSPPSKHRPPPGWQETPQQALDRYQSIADDIAATARNRTEAAYLIGVAYHESAFYADVDRGDCYEGGAFRGRCDAVKVGETYVPRAHSIWQLQEADPDRALLYRTNRRAAAKEALRRIILSLRWCSSNAPNERLSSYAGGDCKRGRIAARSLYAHVLRAAEVHMLAPQPVALAH